MWLAILYPALLYATLVDLKTREVDDWLTHGLFAIGIFGRLALTVFYQDISYVVAGVLGGLVFLGFGWLLYVLGQWGGGDAKLLGAMGAMLGLTFSFDAFMVSFIINLLFAGGIWGIVYSTPFLCKEKGFMLERYVLPMFLLFTVLLWLIDPLLGLAGVLLSVSYVLFPRLKHVEKRMQKKIPVSKLVEGDWLMANVVKNGKMLVKQKGIGLTMQDIALLKKENIKIVRIKEGMPFVPSFLIAFILTLLIGNPLLLL